METANVVSLQSASDRVRGLISRAYKEGNAEGFGRGRREGYADGYLAGEAVSKFDAAGALARAKDRATGVGFLIGVGVGVVGTCGVLGMLTT
jgi:flagellar biosynthesis/type III secretory pathway protein FliH